MSLDAQVLAFMQTGEAVTPAIAWERWRILACHSLMARLRLAGHTIDCAMQSANGRRYGSYTLRAGAGTAPTGLRISGATLAASQSPAHQQRAGAEDAGSLQHPTSETGQRGLGLQAESAAMGTTSAVAPKSGASPHERGQIESPAHQLAQAELPL